MHVVWMGLKAYLDYSVDLLGQQQQIIVFQKN